MNTATGSLLIVASLAACQGASGDGPPANATEVRSSKARLSSTATPTEDVTVVVADCARFGASLHHTAVSATDNAIYSPTSISIALAMTYAGARNETATQMETALQFSLRDARLHAGFNALDQALASRGEGAVDVNGNPFALHIVNKIWGQQGAHFETAFLDTLAENYGAGLFALDFIGAADASRITINDWVADQTNDKIVDLLGPGSITSDTRLVLTNAVYFNASWDTPFERSNTRDGAFATLASGSVTVPFMHELVPGQYAQGSGFELIGLPYDGDEVSMVIALPEEGTDFGAFVSTRYADVVALASDMRAQHLDLSLPKFEATSSISLKSALSELGMVDAFTEAADFSGINGAHDLSISDVVHKAFIRVDERGTEAAAATAVIVGTTSVPLSVTVNVDHPFLFFIRDNATGAILFAGHVVDPS